MSELLDEVNPTLHDEAVKHIKELDEASRVMKPAIREISLSDLKGMLKGDRKSLMAAVGSLVILDLLLISCQLSFSPTKTETAIVPGQTSTLTEETKEEAATSELDENERRVEIVNNVNAFINAEGKYSEEELRKNPYWFELSADKNDPLPMGIIYPEFAQVILVDYLVYGDTVHLYMGSYNNENKRIVLDYVSSATYYPATSVVKSSDGTKPGVENNPKNFKDYLTILDESVGNPINFMTSYWEMPILTEEQIANINSAGYDSMRAQGVFQLSNKTIEYARDVFALLSKDAMDPGNIIPETSKPTDNISSVEYYDKDNLLKTSAFDNIGQETPNGLLTFKYRRP